MIRTLLIFLAPILSAALVTGAGIGVPKSDFFPYGPAAGDSVTQIADDVFTGPINLTFPFPFFNETYRALFVSNNGPISFKRGFAEFTPDCRAMDSGATMIAPFWGDIDVRNGGLIYYRETSNQTLRGKAVAEIKRAFPQLAAVGSASLFITTFDDVAYFGDACTGQNHSRNSFQVVLSTDGVYSFSILNYNEISWTTGSASGGNCAGLGGSAAKAGFDVGDGETFFQLPGSCTSGILDITETSNMGERGKWIFRVDNGLQNSSCSDDPSQRLQISPSFVSVFGHEPLTILGPCIDDTVADDDVSCVFFDPQAPAPHLHTVPATLVRDQSLVLCASPFLYTLGRVDVNVLVRRREADGGRVDTYAGFLYVIEPHADVQVSISPATATDTVSVRLTWDPALFPSLHADQQLNVTMWGLDSRGTWYEAQHVGQVASAAVGQFTATLNAANVNPLVVFMLTPMLAPLLSSRAAFSLPDFLSRYMTESNSAACDRWYAADPGVPSDIQPCPCLLRQAERDPRFKREETLLDFYHPGAAAGFRQREPSPLGAGSQCTYNSAGDIITRGAGAGSADRYSPSGVSGFIGHLREDVWPWFVCHKFSSNLDKYYARRPAHNCTGYRDPGLGGGVGDPHITTFDLSSYTFNGAGEFWMIRAPGAEFGMQARMEVFTEPETGVRTNSSVFTAFVMEDADTKVQVELAPGGQGVDVRLDGDLVQFLGSSMETDMFIPAKSASLTVTKDGATITVTIAFHIGFTFTITRADSTPSFGILALADESRIGRTDGLLGFYDKNPANDLRTPDGATIAVGAPLETIHDEFGLRWMVALATDSLFTYTRGMSYESYSNPSFRPSFEVPDESRIPEQIVALCGGSRECLFDWLATGSASFANATRQEAQVFNETRDSLQEKVRMCVPITELANGYVNYTTNPLDGTVIRFGCDEGFELDGVEQLTCGGGQEQLVWNGEPPTCRAVGSGGVGSQIQGAPWKSVQISLIFLFVFNFVKGCDF